MKKALVVSGGGALGAYGGGMIENFVKKQNKNWDVYVGTSTGSLLVPLTSVGEIDKLKHQYTNVNNNSIYNIAPFNQKGKLRILNAIWRILRGKTSLGEAKKLRKKIEKMFTIQDYEKSIKNGKDVTVCVANMSLGVQEYKSQIDNKYKDFCDWMLASCSVPVAFDLVRKNGYEYLDGGVFDPIPIQHAINQGVEEMDIIILKTKEPDYSGWKSKNMFNTLFRTIENMHIEIGRDDISIGKLSGQQKEVKLNFYYLPYKLTDNSIIFDKKEMQKWWEMGYNYDKDKEGNEKTQKQMEKEGSLKRVKIIKDGRTNRYKIKK